MGRLKIREICTTILMLSSSRTLDTLLGLLRRAMGSAQRLAISSGETLRTSLPRTLPAK